MPEHHNHETPEDDPDTTRPLTPTSTIQLGLVITLLGVCASGFAVWIWWASAINTKLDMLISDRKEQAAAIVAVSKDIVELKSWQSRVEATGTPAMARRMDAQEAALEQIRREFDIHKATSKP